MTAAWLAIGLLLALSVGSALIGWAACALSGRLDEEQGYD